VTEVPTLLDTPTIDRITRRGVSEIISHEEFLRLLQRGAPLRLKMGFDPSRPDIHLGHVVGLRKLRQLQQLGHQVILIVGDWTAQIGDPSGQSATRPMLTHEEVVQNAESYLRQFFKVVDDSRTQVVWQSEWFGKFTLEDVIRLTSKFTVAQFLERADFALRYREHRPIAITELLYPLLQAYDSVAIESEVEFGGTDQKFNLLVGRELQAMMGQPSQQIFTMPLLVGTDGAMKMSKSLNNYVAVEEPPNDMYGKLMSLPDDLIVSYFEYLTDEPEEHLSELSHGLESGAVSALEEKKRLALEITRQFHGPAAAGSAQTNFEQVVQQGSIPEDIPQAALPKGADGQEAPRWSRCLVDLGLAASTTQAKRLIDQKAVEIIKPSAGPVTVESDTAVTGVAPGDVIRVGKRRFVRLVR
jgi:tyrosyl-tRNA synthetase